MAVVCEQGTCMGQCTGCGSGCASTCSSTCSGGCKNGCGSGCSSSCTGTCYTECTGCGSGCANTCTGGCKGGCSSCGDQCSSNCTTSCSGTCSGTCSGGCGTSCSTNCYTGCTTSCTGCRGTCNTTCTGGCGAACSTNCTGSCYDECYSCGGCDNTCYGSCSGCSGSCSGTCSTGCVNDCGRNCADCTGTCTGTCEGCSGTCTGTCTDGCQGGCQGCSGTCKGTCTNTCTGTCSEVCADACDNGCTSNCTFNCVAVCTQSLQYTITITTQNSTATNSGVNYRASGASFSSTASAASANYFYDGWYESGSKISSAATYSFTVTGNRTLLAKSNAKTFTTTTGTSPSGLAAGTVASPTSGTIPGNVTFSITDPAPSTTNYAQGGLEKTITNYAFAGWSFTNASPSTGSSSETTKRVSVSNSVNSSNVVVSGTANFNTSGTPAVYYYCTFSAGAHGSINPNVSDWYSKNASVTLRATGDTGYEFSEWSGDRTGTTNPLTVSITKPLTIQANFRAKQTFTASASVGTAAVSSLVTATVSSPSGYVGDDVTFFVDPSDDISVVTTDTAGTTETTTIYKLGSWSLIGATAIGSVTGANLEATTTSTSVSGTANFTVKSTSKRYKCTFSATSSPSGGGSVTPSGTAWYNDGQIIQVEANPTDNSWKFVSWSDGGDQRHNVTIDRVKNLTATFAKKQIATVTASASISGPTVRATPASTPIYVDETSINFYADLTYSNSGTWGPGTTSRERTITNYAFSGWSYTNISGASTSNNNTSGKATSTSASALASYTQTGTEIVTQYACTFTSDDISKGTVSYTDPDDSPSWYTSGHSITAVATPTNQTYYAFDGWYNGSIKVSSDNRYTFTVSGSVALVAKFKDRKFTASVSASSTPAPSEVTAALAGTAIAGYQSFNHWIGEWVAFSTNSSVTIYSNQTTDSRLKRIYNFQNWSISGGSTASGYSTSSNPCRVVSNDYTVTANANYTLNTSITEYNCSFNVSPSGGGTISGASSGWYAENTRLTLTATPADSTWKFVNWTGDASGTDTQTSVVVTSNLQVGAVFAKKQIFTVSASANIPGPSAIYSPTTGPYYVEETNVTFTADSDYTNIGNWIIEGDRRVKTTTPYTFYRWTFTGATGSSSGDVNARVVTKQAAASQSTAALAGVANYTTGTPVVERQFSCSFGVDSSTKGSVTYPAPDIETGGKKWYNEGRILSIAAVPNAGYAFDHWSDNVGGDGTREITVDQAYSLIAVFRAITYSITVNIGNNNIDAVYTTSSTVSYNGSTEIYASVKAPSTSISPVVNNTRTITTTNYAFSYWTITGNCTDTPETGVDITRHSLTDILSNITATAYGSNSSTSITQYQCFVAGSSGGTISGSETGWYNQGTTLSVTATPNQGYRLAQWSGATASDTITNNGLTISGTAAAGKSWTAVFELIPTYTITYDPGDADNPQQQFTQTKTQHEALTLLGAMYFKNNYVQTGWSNTSGGSKDYDLMDIYTTDAGTTLYPSWTGATCTITASGDNCTVSDPGGTYNYGDTFSSIATIGASYTFLGWFVGDTLITDDRSLVVTVTGNTNYIAKAVLSAYNVIATIGTSSTIASARVTGLSTVAYNGSTTVEAEPKPKESTESIVGKTKTITTTTYSFDHWNVTGNCTVVNPTSKGTIIEDIQSNIRAEANGTSVTYMTHEYNVTADGDDNVSINGGDQDLWIVEGDGLSFDAILSNPTTSNETGPNGDYTYTKHATPTFAGWTYSGNATFTTNLLNIAVFDVQSGIEVHAHSTITNTYDNYKYACVATAGTGVTSATVSENYVTAGSTCTFSCSLSQNYDFDGWYDTNGLVSRDNPYNRTMTSAPARLTAVGKRRYPVYTTGSAEVFNSVTANPDHVYGTNESVTVTAILKTTTDTEKYTFSDWEASNGSVTFTNQTVTTTTATATATIDAFGIGDSVTIMATAVKANAPKYHARFQNKSINLGTVSVSKDQTSKIDEQSFLPVTYKYTAPNNCHVFVGWYDEAEGGTLVSSNATYQCPVQADGSEMTLYAKINFAYANSTIVQWGNASRTLKAFDWLVIRDFINARKRQTYNYVYNTPTNVQPGFTLTANMYNEYTTKLNIPTYEAGETITAACLDLIRDTINGVEPTPPPPVQGYITFSSDNNFTLSTSNLSGSWDGTIEYSLNNGTTWTVWSGSYIQSINNTIYLRGTNNSYITGNSGSIFRITDTNSNIRCDGNIETLLDYQAVLNNTHPIMASWAFSSLFRTMTLLISAPQLPATDLAEYCYYHMFEGCTNLASAPQLPATILTTGCYSGMFEGCTSLTSTPQLSATTLLSGCYSSMFKDCTSLINASTLPATTLVQNCYYQMFRGCTSLVVAPQILATTLAQSCCAYMFYGCTSLTSAPQLLATEAALSCYSYMFYNCTSLTIVPSLPATTLASGCYSHMFDGCSNLITLPVLNAHGLSSNCYAYMFYNCTKICLSMTQDSTYINSYRIPPTGGASVQSGAVSYMFANTGGTTTVSRAETTYYTSNTIIE